MRKLDAIVKPNAISRFFLGDSGAMTAGGLLLLIAILAIGGVAADVARAIYVRSQVQVTADAMAHTALYQRNRGMNEVQAKSAAMVVASQTLSDTAAGTATLVDAISFGTWDAVGRSFTNVANSKTAVQVNASMLAAKGNGVGAYLLQFAGFDNFDIRNTAVFETYYPPCLQQGFFARGMVDIQSNNTYKEGFCIHSNTVVKLSQNNVFEKNVVVSMPDKNDVIVPSGNCASGNTGLCAALHDASYEVSILNDLPFIYADLLDRTLTAFTPTIPGTSPPTKYNETLVTLSSAKQLEPTDFTANRIHWASCNSNQKLTFKDSAAASIYQNFALVTNCKIQLPANGEFRNVTIITSNTGEKNNNPNAPVQQETASIRSASGLKLGAPDNCGSGGGVTLMSYGSVNIASGLEMYGSRIISLKDVAFTANATAIQGGSIIAGGTISGTSNMTFAVCPKDGTLDDFMLPFFRLAI